MLKFPWTMLVAAPLFAGCGLFGSIDEDNFNDKYAEAACDLIKTCYPVQWDGAYDSDSAECIDDQTDQRKDFDDLYDGCDFDDGAAEDCVDAVKNAQCSDLYDPDDAMDVFADCQDVWDCG